MINLFIYLRPILKYKSNAFNVTKLKSVSRISTNLYSVMHWNIYYILMCHHKRKSAYYALYLIMVPPARIELATDPYHGSVMPFN